MNKSQWLTGEQKKKYKKYGFILIRDVLPLEKINHIEKKFLEMIEEWSGGIFKSTQPEGLAKFLLGNRELERKLYDGVRHFSWLSDFCKIEEIARPVSELIGSASGVMEKIPFRIDLPRVIRELAVWHQDYNYVKGNTEVITAWIPLQHTSYATGCLMVMPGSQNLGVLNHDMSVLGKRHFPSDIFEREVRYVEMQKGDLLLFNSLLLHSSGLNISSIVRLSIQARYSALSSATDAAMGRVTAI